MSDWIRSGRRIGLLTLLLAAPALLAGGCQNELKAQRDQLRKENKNLQQELKSTRQALEQAEQERAQLTDQVATLEDKVASAEDNPFADVEGVDVSAGGGKVTVRVPGDVLFASGKATVRDSAKKTLNQIADVLNSEYAGKTIRVEGYTDPVPIEHSDWADNLELSAARAMAVERQLQSQGISGDRMYSAAFADAKQRETNAKSRRVEIVVVMNEKPAGGGGG